MIELRPYQTEFVNDIRAAMRESKRVLGVAATGAGKCLARGTPILLFDGRIKVVESIRIGDLLMGPDSNPRVVVSLARGKEEMFRIVPKKGETFTVNRSHVISLKLSRKNANSPSHPDIVNISLHDYLKQNNSFKRRAKIWRTGVEFETLKEPLKLEPYFVGAWLGDGSSDSASITTGDPEIESYIFEYADRLGLRIREENNSPNSKNYYMIAGVSNPGRGHRTNPVTLALNQYNMLRNKHIPHIYKVSSRSDRLQLLAGLLDTDGHFNNNCYDLILKSERLMDDAIYLAQSLGFSAHKKRCRKTCTNTGVTADYFRTSVCGHINEIPCKIARKKASPRRQIKDVLCSGFAVESIGEDDYYGFEISGPDRLFLLGDFTVTHNTVVFSYISYHAAMRGNRIIIAAHRFEICSQISNALIAMGIRHGFIMPGKTPTDDAVQVAMIATLARRLDRISPPSLLIVDEAHHAPGSQYEAVLARFPNAFVLGFTATPERLDGKGLRKQFDTMVLGPQTRWLVESGFLSQYTYLAPPQVADFSGVKKRAGDYAIDELAAIMDKSTITGDIIAHQKKYLGDKSAIAFCINIQHSENVAAQFNEAGIPAASIDGKTSKPERQRLLSALGDGSLKVLTSADLIGEGVDVPSVNGAILMRPTASVALHLQQVGRVLRLKPDGSRAIILDHVGAVHRHGLPDLPRAWSLDGRDKKAKGLIKTRACETCYRVFQVAPDWLTTAECGGDPPMETGCVLVPKEDKAPARVLETREGELAEITESPDWAGGINVMRASGAEFKAMLGRARTKEQLQEIARIRGYKSHWVFHILKQRHEHIT